MKIVNIVSIVMIITMLMVPIVSAELTTNAKNWLANNAGINGCLIHSGVNYLNPDGQSRIGGSGDVVNAFYVAHLVGRDDAVIIANTNYAQLKVINGLEDLTMGDVGHMTTMVP